MVGVASSSASMVCCGVWLHAGLRLVSDRLSAIGSSKVSFHLPLVLPQCSLRRFMLLTKWKRPRTRYGSSFTMKVDIYMFVGKSVITTSTPSENIVWFLCCLLSTEVENEEVPSGVSVVCLCCRDARNMARDVHSILFDLVKEKGEMDDDAANTYIKKLQSRGRYLQDVWS